MLTGIFLIALGVLIVLYPWLLSTVVATILVLIGITSFVMSYSYKRMSRRFDNPYINFFFRF